MFRESLYILVSIVGLFDENHDSGGQSWILMPMGDIDLPLLSCYPCQPAIPPQS